MPHFKPVSYDIWDIFAASKRPLLLYGMGDGADKLIVRLESLNIPYADVYASDGFVRGQFFHGKQVISFSKAKEQYGDFLTALAFASERSEVVEQIANMAKENDILVPDLPIAGETFFDKTFYNAHLDQLNETYNMLADEHSKTVFESVLKAKLYGNWSDLIAHTTFEEENAKLIPFSMVRFAVDGGAYKGDTAAFIIERAPQLHTVYAIEPDAKTYAKLANYAQNDNRIQPIHAVLKENGESVTFYSKGGRSSTVTAKLTDAKAQTVAGISIDILCKNQKVDFLKFDVEGAEKEALEGAKQTIQRDLPAIKMALYHRSEDLFALPLALKNICSGYDFYIRRIPCFPAWEVNLYAVPKGIKIHET